MDTSTLQLTVIYTFCALFLTVPYGSSVSENAATTIGPQKCYGNGIYAFTRKIGKNARGATNNAAKTLEQCKEICATTACSSFDYNYGNSDCWIHVSYVENALGDISGVDHFERIACPVVSTPAASTLPPTTIITGATTLPACFGSYSFDEYKDTYVTSGQRQPHITAYSCLEACSLYPATCTSLDFNVKDNSCWFHSSAVTTQTMLTATTKNEVTHWIRKSCVATTPLVTTLPPTTNPTTPSPNAPVSFRVLFTNDYDSTVRDLASFISSFRAEFCDDTGVRCARLLKPQVSADVRKITVKETPGPQIGSIEVIGMLGPAEGTETNTQTVMTDFEGQHYANFRHRLGPENDNIRLTPDTSQDYSGFTWERMETTAAPVGKDEDEEGPLGLKIEYWILIGLGILALIVTIIAIVVICCLRKSNSESSESAQKRKEKKKAEKERKREEKEEKKKAAKERKEREKEEKEQRKNEKKDKDVEKGEEENQYQEPDVVPTKTDDSPSGLSDDDKAY